MQRQACSKHPLACVHQTSTTASNAVGLFAIVSYAAARRTREIGVRVALGAGPGVVGRLILGSGLVLVMLGCGLPMRGAPHRPDHAAAGRVA